MGQQNRIVLWIVIVGGVFLLVYWVVLHFFGIDISQPPRR